MKYSYGRTSSGVLITASFNLQLVFDEALAMGLIDISAIESRRAKARQNRLYRIDILILIYKEPPLDTTSPYTAMA